MPDQEYQTFLITSMPSGPVDNPCKIIRVLFVGFLSVLHHLKLGCACTGNKDNQTNVMLIDLRNNVEKLSESEIRSGKDLQRFKEFFRAQRRLKTQLNK